MSRSSRIPSTGKLVAIHSHKRKSRKDMRGVQEKHFTNQRTRTEQQEVRDFSKFRAEEAVQGEHEALSRHSEAEFHTAVLLERQRNQILSEEKSEISLQESRAEC